MQFDIRRWTPKDNLPISLRKDLYLEENGKNMDTEAAVDCFVYYTRPSADIFIANVNGSDIGYAVGMASESTYYSDGLYVSPDFRRRGIAQALKREQIQSCRRRGLSLISTHVDHGNIASINLQRKIGARVGNQNIRGFEFRLAV